jgi:hypothetical protein
MVGGIKSECRARSARNPHACGSAYELTAKTGGSPQRRRQQAAWLWLAHIQNPIRARVAPGFTATSWRRSSKNDSELWSPRKRAFLATTVKSAGVRGDNWASVAGAGMPKVRRKVSPA